MAMNGSAITYSNPTIGAITNFPYTCSLCPSCAVISFTPFFLLFSLLIPDYHTATTKIIGRNSYLYGKCIVSDKKKVTKTEGRMG